jgi:hypothetical protein
VHIKGDFGERVLIAVTLAQAGDLKQDGRMIGGGCCHPIT